MDKQLDENTALSTESKPTRRRYRDGDSTHRPWTEEIFTADESHKCPTYVHRTPPCQGSCPSGEDIRGWLSIVRGIEKPGDPEMPWQEYAFRRMTDANPFPSIMGRVCPAPCEDGCNRNAVEEFVGINSIEHFVGDYALGESLSFDAAGADTGKKVAIIGGGPAGLAAAYHLRRRGHGATIFDDHDDLGGLMRYGIPGYRTPRDVLDQEIRRITDMGVELRLATRIGRDVTLADLEEQYDAVVVAIGAKQGSTLPIPGAEGTSNCLTGVDFLEAFNTGRLLHTAKKVVVIGGGDTAMDVAAVARRLGHIEEVSEKDRPEMVVLGFTTHDVATVANRQGAHVTVLSREPLAEMPASTTELEHVAQEGVSVRGSVLPVEVIKGDDGRAVALKVVEVTWSGGQTSVVEGSEFEIECDLVVGAIGQKGDLEGLEALDDGNGKIKAGKFFEVPDKPGYFIIGDAVRPHLLTTAIGHASIAADSIDQYFAKQEPGRRPKVDVHHFDLLSKLREEGHEPETYDSQQVRGTADSGFAVHNYDDRSAREIIASDQLFLGHWQDEARNRRLDEPIGPDAVLGHFEERIVALSEEQVRTEANRCMSCGMCFECDNCVVFCPQDAIFRVKKDQKSFGRYVDTDYTKCVGCHICADVCPSGYIEMGMGE
jgi:NADPH-dependent glutamate synthase beta subunit-like oxidoreductase